MGKTKGLRQKHERFKLKTNLTYYLLTLFPAKAFHNEKVKLTRL